MTNAYRNDLAAALAKIEELEGELEEYRKPKKPSAPLIRIVKEGGLPDSVMLTMVLLSLVVGWLLRPYPSLYPYACAVLLLGLFLFKHLIWDKVRRRGKER